MNFIQLNRSPLRFVGRTNTIGLYHGNEYVDSYTPIMECVSYYNTANSSLMISCWIEEMCADKRTILKDIRTPLHSRKVPNTLVQVYEDGREPGGKYGGASYWSCCDIELSGWRVKDPFCLGALCRGELIGVSAGVYAERLFGEIYSHHEHSPLRKYEAMLKKEYDDGYKTRKP